MRGARAEIVLIREALEGVLAPELATAILFDALALAPVAPSSLHEARSFVSGPLSEVVGRRVRPSEITQVIRLMQGAIDSAIDRDGVDVDIDFDPTASSSGVQSTETQQMSTIARPVPVVVFAVTGLFAERLELCLGEDRVYTVTVGDAAALRKSLFAQSPLLVVVDATASEHVEPERVLEVLRGIPDNVVPVLWGGETKWGARLLALAPGRPQLVTLERSEGIEPLCDLILSRFRGGN